jgi:hypothetical protein
MAKRRRPTSKKKVPPTPVGRVGILYGLSGLFVVVVSGLIVARPGPLTAPLSRYAAPQVLAATREIDPIESALQTSAPVQAGVWKRVSVRTLTWPEVEAVRPHFTVSVDPGSGVALTVGSNWLQQKHEAGVDGDTGGEIVLAIVGNENDTRIDETVTDLIERLCARLRLTPRQVRWS